MSLFLPKSAVRVGIRLILHLIITIILVPKLNPIVQEYIESKFIADIGLGIFIYIISLFVIIKILTLNK